MYIFGPETRQMTLHLRQLRDRLGFYAEIQIIFLKTVQCNFTLPTVTMRSTNSRIRDLNARNRGMWCTVLCSVRTLFECCLLTLEIFLLRQKKHLKRKLFINLLIFKKDRKNAKLVDSS